MNTLTNTFTNKKLQIAIIVMIAIALILAFADPSLAQLSNEAQKGVDAVDPGGSGANLSEVIKKVINFLLFTVGVLSVIMIIIGGIRYVVSGGDPGATKSARDTILYALIGLVVAFVAYGIVRFVTELF